MTTQEDENTTLNSVGIDGDGSVVAHKASLEDLHRITRCLSENDGASCDSASQENSEPDKNMNLVETKIPTKFSKIPRWSIKRKSRSVSETIHKESNAKSSTSNNSKAPLKSTRNSSSNHSHTTKAHEQDTKDVSTNCTVAEKQKINESFAGPGTDSHNMAFASNFDSRLLSPIISEKSAPFESLKFRNDKIGNLETSPVGTFSEGFHPSRSTLLCPRENNTCRNDNHGSPESKSDPVFYPRFTRSYSDIDLFGGKDRQSENFSSSERHNRSYTTPESAFSSQYRPLFTKRNNGLYGETNEKEAMGSRIYIGKDSGLLATKINFSVPCYELKYNSPYTYNDRIGHSSHVGGETNQHRRNDSSSFRTGSSPSSNEYRPQFDAVGISVPHTTPGSNPNKEVSRDTRFVNGQFESMLQSKPNMYGRHYNEEEHVTDPSYTQTPPVLLGGLGRSHSHIGSFSSEPRLESTASDETTSDYKSPLLERACKLLESNFVDWRTSSSIRPNVSGYSNTSEQHWDSKALTRSYPNFRPSTFSHQPVVKPTIGNRRSSLESPSAFRLSLSSGAVPSPIEKDSSTVFTSKSGVVESVLSPRYNEPASSIRNDSNYIAAATPSNNSDSTATKSRIPVNSKDSLQMCRGSSLQYKISDNEALRKIKQGAYLQGMKKMPFSSTSVSPLSGSNDEAQRGGRDSDSYTEKTSPRVEKLQQQLISYQERRKRIDKEYDERRLLRKVNAVSKGANDNTQKRNIPASYQGSGSDDLIQCYDRSLSDGTTQYHNQSSTHDNSGFRDDFEQNSTSTTNEFVSASLQYKNLEDKGMDSKPQAVSSKISSLQEKTTSEVFRSGLLTEYSINPKSEEILYDTNISLDAFQGHNIHRESDNISENVTNPIIKSKGDNVKKSAKGIISNSLPTSKQTIAPNASTTTRRFETPDKATRIAGSDSVCNRSQRNSSHTCVHTHPRSKLTGHTLDGRTQDAKPVSNSKLKYPSKRQIEVQSGQERLDSNHPHLMRTVSESCNTPEANKVRPKMKKAVSEQSLSVLPTKRQRRKKTVDKSNTLSNDDVNIQSVKGNKLTENHKASDKTREKSNSDKGASKGPSIETSSPSRGQSRIPVLRRAVSEEHIKIDRQQNSYSESSENSKMRIAMSSKAIVNLGRISESPTNSLTRQSLESEGSGDKEYPDTTVINTMDTTELIERLKVLSEVSPTRSGRSSPNPFASQRMQYDFEPIEDPSDLNRCFSPIITIENPTPDNISSQVSYDAFGIETIAERNNLKTSDNKKGESISRETSIGSASDIWTEDGSALPTFRSKCRRSSSGASGQSEESSNYSR